STLFVIQVPLPTVLYSLSLHDALPISPLRAAAVWLRLDDGAFSRKLAAAFEFYPELAAEVRDGLQGLGQEAVADFFDLEDDEHADRKSTRLNSSHSQISYAVFCLKK